MMYLHALNDFFFFIYISFYFRNGVPLKYVRGFVGKTKEGRNINIRFRRRAVISLFSLSKFYGQIITDLVWLSPHEAKLPFSTTIATPPNCFSPPSPFSFA